MVELLTRDEIERRYRVKKSRLESLAHRGLPPVYYKPGRMALYPTDLFEQWLGTTSPNAPVRQPGCPSRRRGRPRATKNSPT